MKVGPGVKKERHRQMTYMTGVQEVLGISSAKLEAFLAIRDRRVEFHFKFILIVVVILQ